MGLFRWFSVVAVAFVLAGTTPALAQGMPDEATRASVADWIERCGRPSDACWPVIKRIEESALGRWCRAIEAYWDTARLVRDPETVLHSIEELRGRREKAREFLAECVPIFAAALDEAGGTDDGSSDAVYRGPVEPADRVMQAVKRSNLRSGPGTTHDKVGLLAVGDEVRVTGAVGDWLRIEAPAGGEAFVYGPLLAVAAPHRVTTTAAQEAEPPSTNVAVTETVEDPDMPDAATRERVADWMLRCQVQSHVDDCRSVGVRIKETALGQECWGMDWLWGDQTLLRDPSHGLNAIPEGEGLRRTAEDFLVKCVPIYATGLDKAGEGDNGSRNTADVDTAIGLEPKCTLDLPQGSGCWQELIEQPDCHVWVGYWQPDSDTLSWTGNCDGGVADGDGTLRMSTPSGSQFEAPATISAGRITFDRDSSGYIQGLVVLEDRPVASSQQPAGQDSTSAASDASRTGPLHGSIAFSQDDDGAYAWGIAWSFDGSAGAQAEALGQCREYGGTRCAEAGWFQEACGALAIGDGNGYGTGWGATTGEAERDALAQCRVSNDDCRIEVARGAKSEEAGGSGRQQQENMTAGRDANDTRLASASPVLEPKCGDGGTHSHCWREFSNKPGCHAFAIPDRFLSSIGSDLGESVPATWSGDCANGIAVGQGTVVGRRLLYPSERTLEFEHTGAFSNGIPSGNWVERSRVEGETDTVTAGQYVEGLRHGDWIYREESGRGRPEVCIRYRYSNGEVLLSESGC